MEAVGGQRVDQSEDRLSLLHAVAEVTASPLPVREVFSRALSILHDELGLQGTAYELEADGNLHVLASAGFDARVERRLQVLPLDRIPQARELLAGQLPGISHVDVAPRLASRLGQELRIESKRWLILPLMAGGVGIGILGFSAEGRRDFSGDEMELLTTAAGILTGSLASSRRSAEETAQRLRAERETAASRAVLRAAEAMAEHADLHGVLSSLADALEAFLGDVPLRITLLDSENDELTVVVGRDSASRQTGSRIPMSALDPIVLQAIHERRSAVVEGATEQTGPFGCRAFLFVPVVGHGRVIGTLETCQDVDRDAVGEHMRVLEAIAAEASSAIENAEAFERQRRAAELRESLNQVNTLLAGSLDRPVVLDDVLTEAAVALRATAGLFVEQERHGWRVTRRVGVRQTIAPEGRLNDLEGAWIDRALVTNAPVVRFEQTAVVVVPLQFAERVFGALLFGQEQVTMLDADTLDFATKLGAAVSMALGNQFLYRHEREIAETLQQALLSIPETVPGLELAHFYAAATERTRVGGDFYDAFEVGEHKVALVVGDVSGKGIEAAALTALVKNTLKAHAVEGQPVDAVLEKTNETLVRFSAPEVFVTVSLLLVDVASHKVTYSSAGHPPTMLISDGHVVPLDVVGPLLGAFPGVRYTPTIVDVSPRDTLVMYTDGITEAHRDGELYGEERLMRLLNRVKDLPLAEMPEAMVEAVERFASAGLSDDLALLLARVR